MKLVVLSEDQVRGTAVCAVGKPAVFVRFGLEFVDKQDAVIWDFVIKSLKEKYDDLMVSDLASAIMSNFLIFFDTEEQQREFYEIFEHEIVYSSALYAVTYNKRGECITCNT